MKKHLSVFSLTARESIYRIFFVYLLSGIVQAAAFIFMAEKLAGIQEVPSINDVFNLSYIRYIFFVFLLIIFILLSKTGMQFSSKTGYTLRRLNITEKSVYIWQSVYNFIILLITVLFEVVLCFFLSSAAARILPEEFITGQSIYIAFYENYFLQNLFAGRDIVRIVRNILALISLSVNFAAFSYLFRRGKKWIGAVIVTAVSFILFVRNQDISYLSEDVALISFFVIMTFAAITAVCLRGEQYD